MYGYAYPPGYPGFAYPGVAPPGFSQAASAAVLTPAAPEPDRSDVVGFGYGASKERAESTSKKSQKSKKDKTTSRDSWPEGLAVTGCKDKTVKKIVRGNFTLAGENHGRPYYKRDEKFNELDVMIYYWDDRDGSDFCGWWFGPKVGGDQVWAYQSDKSPTPPLGGWKVPYDGPVDKNLSIQPQATKKAEGAVAYAVPQPGYWYPGMPPPYLDQHAAERQMQEHARLHQEAVKRYEEEVKRHQQEEQRRRDDAKRREEEAKRKQEEMRRKREEDARRAKELQEQRIKEGKAVFLVRKVMQKVAMATPDTLETLQKELDEVMKQELEATGSQKAQMTSECEKCLEQAKKRIEILNEAKRKALEKKEADEKKRQELETRAKELLQELSNLLDAAEAGIDKLKETCAPLEGSEGQSLQEVEACSDAVEASGAEAKALTKAAMDFLVAKGPEMKDPPALVAPGALATASEIKQTMAKLLTRMNECSKMTDMLLAAARAVKDAAVRRATAKRQTSELEASFARYDKDGDQALSKTEVAAYAKAEYQMTLSDEVMAKIMKSCADDDQNGVTLRRFHLLKLKLGTERELERDRERKAVREAREKVRKILRSKLDAKVQLIEHAVEGIDKAVAKAEQGVPPLATKARSAIPEGELIAQMDACVAMIEAAREVAASVQQKIDAIPTGFDDKHQADVKELLAPDMRVLGKTMGRFELRLVRSLNLCARFRKEASKRKRAEIYGARCFAAKVARQHASRKGLNKEDLFREIDANGDGEISEQEFLKFFSSVDKEIQEEAVNGEEDAAVAEKGSDAAGAAETAPDKVTAAVATPKPAEKVKENRDEVVKVDLTPEILTGVFHSLVANGSATISKEAFSRMMRAYYKVTQESVLTADLEVTGSNTVRQVSADEVVELLDVPVQEESMKVVRAKCRAVSDEAEGWLTIRGNQGNAYLRERRVLFRVLRDSQLSGASVPPEEGAEPEEGKRKLMGGEVVEVVAWPRKHEESGLIRMEVQALRDGALGWITQSNKDGVISAELF